MEDIFFNKLQVYLENRSKKVEGSACVEWTGSVNKDGYGVVRLKLPSGQTIHTTAHRAVYMFKNKILEIPKEEQGHRLEVSHLCHVRFCVNIEHLVLELASTNRERKMCVGSHVCIGHNPACMLEVC